MINVLKAEYAQGYSGYDHLLDDSELDDCKGRMFDSVAQAKKYAAKLRCDFVLPSRTIPNLAPIRLYVRLANHTERWV